MKFEKFQNSAPRWFSFVPWFFFSWSNPLPKRNLYFWKFPVPPDVCRAQQVEWKYKVFHDCYGICLVYSSRRYTNRLMKTCFLIIRNNFLLNPKRDDVPMAAEYPLPQRWQILQNQFLEACYWITAYNRRNVFNLW